VEDNQSVHFKVPVGRGARGRFMPCELSLSVVLPLCLFLPALPLRPNVESLLH
jgi:hypothetical protein